MPLAASIIKEKIALVRIPKFIPFTGLSGGFLGMNLQYYHPLKRRLHLLLTAGIQRHWMEVTENKKFKCNFTSLPLEAGIVFRP